MDLINENTSVSDAFFIGWGIMVLLADVSEIKDGEVVCLAAKNPPIIAHPEKWDGVLEYKKPIVGDLGIDNKRNMYWYVNNNWKSIKGENGLISK